MFVQKWLKIGIASCCAFALPTQADTFNIAVAANFTAPMQKLEALFEEKSDHDVVVTYGSTGKLYTKIKNGEPFSLFFAADTKRPKLLIDEGLAVADSFRVYALGQLVLWSTDPHRVDARGKILQRDTFNYLAMTNPNSAPYGAAAQQILQKHGVWDKLASKIVWGENLLQTYQLIVTGHAELGFIALSQYKVSETKGSIWLVSNADYTPLEQAVVTLSKGAENTAVTEFLAFLQRPVARKLIEDFGYAVPSTYETRTP